MTTYKGTIAKQPIIKDKIIFSAIKTANSDKPIQIVLFKGTVEKKFADLLETLNLNDEITIAGKEQRNKLNNQREISIAEIYVGNAEVSTDKWSINPETDFIIGGETAYGTIQIVERPKCESYYTDGEMYWYTHSTIKAPCNL